MAYTINKTNGDVLATIADGTLNTDTSLVLVGKNYSGYGEFINENFLRLLENSADTEEPSDPLTGELWYDLDNNSLKVFSGTVFKDLATINNGATEPPIGERKDGDLWWDTVARQLKVWSETLNQWLVIGPLYSSETGVSGPVTQVITDTLGNSHIVVIDYVGGHISAIVSKDATFTPLPPISGFATIKPGENYPSTLNSNQPLLWGTAEYALNANTANYANTATFANTANYANTAGSASELDGYTYAELTGNFVLKAGPTQIMTADLAVRSTNGVSVGSADQLDLSSSGSTVTIANTSNDGNMIFNVLSSSVVQPAITISGASGNVVVHKTLMPSANNTQNIGSASTRWATVYGTAIEALYADLAECYLADARYPRGTVMRIGGTAEITVENSEASDDVFGVVSSNPAYTMNSELDGGTKVALIGRVPVRVVGKVAKNDRLISAGNGCARAALRGEMTAFNVIGRALADKTTDDEALLEAFVSARG